MFRFLLIGTIALPFGVSEATTSHWIWSVVPGKRNASECDTEACAGVTSFGGAVLSSSEEVNACLLSVPSSCSFEVSAAPRNSLSGSVKTTGGDGPIFVDLQSLNAADEVHGMFGWGSGTVEVLLAKPVANEDPCVMAIGYSSRICSEIKMETMEAAQSASAKSGKRMFAFSPGEVYRSAFKCLQIYPSGSWDVCGGAVSEVKFRTPRLVNTGLNGRLDTSTIDATKEDSSSDSDSSETTDGNVGKVHTATTAPGQKKRWLAHPIAGDYTSASEVEGDIGLLAAETYDPNIETLDERGNPLYDISDIRDLATDDISSTAVATAETEGLPKRFLSIAVMAAVIIAVIF